jgi:glycosyltransferase involved in cell wall biosynthesis
MLHFCEHILPLVRARSPQATVTWVGRAPSTVQREYAERYGIRMTGYVDDITNHLQAAACCIVPLRAGGGTRLKILDAWAAARAVVSTRVGCEGLDARDHENILIRDDPAEFAAAVCDVLENADLRHGLGRAGRATAEELYDWEHVGDTLIFEYLEVARHGHSRYDATRGVGPR